MEQIIKLHIDIESLLGTLNKDDFMKFTRIISNNNNLELFQAFLIELQFFYDQHKTTDRYPQIEPKIGNIKIFFAYYTLIYYPDVMNIDKNSVTAKNMSSKGASMRINFLVVLNIIKQTSVWNEFNKKKLALRIKEFLNSYYEFIERFNDWKDLDKECLLYNLTKTYYELENDFKKIDFSEEKENSKELYDITKKNVESEKKKTINKVCLVDNKKGKEKFDIYYKLLEDKDNFEIKKEEYLDKLMESLKNNINKAYWDLMKEDLEKEPPNTISFINNLKELKNLVVSCVNKKVELRKDIDKVIDVELIDQMIKHKAYQYNDLENIIQYVNDLLWKFQAPIEDENTRIYEREIKEKLKNKENIISVLISFLSTVIPKFENILLAKYEIMKNLKNENNKKN